MLVAAREEILREDIASDRGILIPIAGPKTAGQTISIAGVFIKLPIDAYLNGIVVSGVCTIGDDSPCIFGPFQIIKRGNSTISVSTSTGEIVHEEVAPGEDGAFDFLKDGLAGATQ